MSRKILEHPKCRPGKTRPCVVLQRHMHHSSNYYLNVGQKSHYSLTHLILHFLTEPDHSALLAINAHREFLFQWQKGILLQILLIEKCIEPQEKSKISRKFSKSPRLERWGMWDMKSHFGISNYKNIWILPTWSMDRDGFCNCVIKSTFVAKCSDAFHQRLLVEVWKNLLNCLWWAKCWKLHLLVLKSNWQQRR